MTLKLIHTQVIQFERDILWDKCKKALIHNVAFQLVAKQPWLSGFVQWALRAGAVTAEYSQSPTRGSQSVIAIASQSCNFLSLYKLYIGNVK